MKSLEDICKKDKEWRRVAKKICGCQIMADDVVQDMYLYFQNNKKEINDYYVFLTIKTIYLQKLRKEKKIIKVVDWSLIENTIKFEDGLERRETDREKKLLDALNALPFHQRELLLENQTLSLRKIQKRFNIDMHFAYREIKKAKREINLKIKKHYHDKR